MENYLIKVLRDWKEFCKGHRLFAEAIEQVLLENARLQEENERLKNQVEKNNR
ncbi:MAG: hypothetical protein IIW20_05315 [Clostridia bacterium]|nr:hypothetical protein [Clostridia bacterium]